MNRDSSTLLYAYIFLMLLAAPVQFFGQEEDHKPLLSQQEMQDYMHQSRQLVRFMEFAFNTLGDPNVSAREKDIIINQSYLKFFTSSKVQIEDDLVEGRFTVTNKNVQAYLKDIDFFFDSVVFTFYIEDVSYNVNDKGQVFFIVTSNRNLSGVNVEGDTIFNNQKRFIEINLDRDKRDLKIASIYTKNLSEKEDMRNWWAALGADWRLIFAKGIMINDEFPLRDILDFDDKWILFERFQVAVIEGFVMESRRADTIYTEPGQIYQEISRLWKTESIDITAYPYIINIDPLRKLTELRSINISGTHVDDLTPIRNLTRLENLNISGTYIKHLDPLRHAIKLKSLDASHTEISDLLPLQAFPALERLDLSSTLVADLEPISSLHSLRDLRLSHTAISDLSPLNAASKLIVLDISNTLVKQLDGLEQVQLLERLHANNTGISKLSPISKLPELQYIFIEATNVADIQTLTELPSLKRIYCDRTPITREKASKFMQESPNVLVIYESQALTVWWAGLPQTWRDVFKKKVSVSEPPTREELHKVANITQININGNKEIFSLSPLQQLLGLRVLHAANTNILSIDPLKENIDLVELDVSSTHVYDISVLSYLRIIEVLNLAHTALADISPLKASIQLIKLNLDYTNIQNIRPLTSINKLETVFSDGIGLNVEEVSGVYDANPRITIVFQTEKLNTWWQSLPDAWLGIFREHSLLNNPPTRLQLHRLTDLTEVNISGFHSLGNLEALKHFHRLEVLKMNDVQISDITPLAQLRNLKELYSSNNPISNLKPLSNLKKLNILDLSNTLVRNLNEIRALPNIGVLSIAGTRVRNLRALSNMHSLRQLHCYNTRIRSLRPIENLKNLELLRSYNTPLWPWSLNRFMKSVPDCEVIYY